LRATGNHLLWAIHRGTGPSRCEPIWHTPAGRRARRCERSNTRGKWPRGQRPLTGFDRHLSAGDNRLVHAQSHTAQGWYAFFRRRCRRATPTALRWGPSGMAATRAPHRALSTAEVNHAVRALMAQPPPVAAGEHTRGCCEPCCRCLATTQSCARVCAQ